MPARVLIVNGNTRQATDRMVALGGRPYGEGYAAALRTFAPDLDCTVLCAADGETLPTGVGLSDFDGIAWTGSALSATSHEPAVRRQIELARQVFEAGVPGFGSCWGQQIMCAALGGQVRANPKGPEVGIARGIRLTDAGAAHAMYEGKGPAFEAVTIHRDEVAALPPGATVLATNAMSDVQAVEIRRGRGRFWGVQYHPEFDLGTIAILMERDRDDLIARGLFPDLDAVRAVATDFDLLHDDPARHDLARRHALDAAVLEPSARMRELANWLRSILGTVSI